MAIQFAELLATVRGAGSDVFDARGLPVDVELQPYLEHFDGNKRRTARALGISVKTLYNRLDRYRREG